MYDTRVCGGAEVEGGDGGNKPDINKGCLITGMFPVIN